MIWIGLGIGLVIGACVGCVLCDLLTAASIETPRFSDGYAAPDAPILCTFCWARPAVALGPYRQEQSPLCAECAQKLGVVVGGDK